MKSILLISVFLSSLEFAYAQVNKAADIINASTRQWNNKIEFRVKHFKKYFDRQDTIIKITNFTIDRTEYSTDSIYNFQALENGTYKFILENETFYEIDTTSAKIYITSSINRKEFKSIVNSGINYSVIFYPLMIACTFPFAVSKAENIDVKFDSSSDKFNVLIDHKAIPEMIDYIKEVYRLDSAKNFVGYELTAKMKNDAIQYVAYFIQNTKQVDSVKKATDIINAFYPTYQIIQSEKIDVVDKVQTLETNAGEFEHFALEDDEGALFSTTTIRSNFVLLDFSYKKCLPCIKSIPVINKIREKYSKDKLEVLVIDPYDKINEIEDFRKTYNINHKILLDYNKKVVNQFQVTGYPTFLLIDIKHKKVVAKLNGYSENLEHQLTQILNENVKK